MTAMTQERQAPGRIRRPAAGIDIDPRLLVAWRNGRALSRQEMSDRIRNLGWKDDRDAPLVFSRDAIAKIENGYRRPRPLTLRAICAVLECSPPDLMPGGSAAPMTTEAAERAQRLDHNEGMREFARANGFTYRNPDTGRVYYSKTLRECYAAHLAQQDQEQDPEQDPGHGELLAG